MRLKPEIEKPENRTLVTIKCQPLAYPKMLPSTEIKTENIESSSELRNNLFSSTVKSDFDDISIISEPNDPIIISDDEIDEPLEKQGTITESINNGTVTMKIKSECIDSVIFKPISIIAEDKCVSTSLEPVKLPKTKFKKEFKDADIVYSCCNMKFYDKFQHFEHMISHTENIIRRQAQRKDIQCYYCHRLFTKEVDMIRHAKSQHTGFYCSYCQCNFPMKYLLLRHLEQAHRMTLKKNFSMSSPDFLQWRKQTSYHKNSIKKIKSEKDPPSTPNIKITPDIGKVKTEANTTNTSIIKTEPLTNIKNEFITVKIEAN